jgi:hypothetical protein
MDEDGMVGVDDKLGVNEVYSDIHDGLKGGVVLGDKDEASWDIALPFRLTSIMHEVERDERHVPLLTFHPE